MGKNEKGEEGGKAHNGLLAVAVITGWWKETHNHLLQSFCPKGIAPSSSFLPPYVVVTPACPLSLAVLLQAAP